MQQVLHLMCRNPDSSADVRHREPCSSKSRLDLGQDCLEPRCAQASHRREYSLVAPGRQDFHDKKGELRYEDKGSKVIVQGDINGDGKADFEIFVKVSALAYVRLLYAQPVPGQDARYSPRQDEIWYMCLERAQGDYDLCPGFNMFVMTKEAKPNNLKVEPVSDDGKTAEVKASFNNGERDVVVVFSLIYGEDEGWLIEEMTSDCVTLSDALTGIQNAETSGPLIRIA